MEADSFCRTSLWYDSNTASEHFTHAMLFLNGDDGLKTHSTVYDINRDRWSEVSISLSGKIENFSILQIEVSSKSIWYMAFLVRINVHPFGGEQLVCADTRLLLSTNS